LTAITVKDFLVESYENLDRLDRDLVGLEKNPHDRDALSGVFRAIPPSKAPAAFRVSPITGAPLKNRASGRGRRCAGYKTLRDERRKPGRENADRDFFHDSHSCGGLPPHMTTSTRLSPTTSSILLAKRLAFPSALNSPVNPNNPE